MHQILEIIYRNCGICCKSTR